MTTIRDASEDEEEEEDAEDAEDAEDDGDQEQAYEEEDFSDAYREGYGDGPERDHGEGDEESIFEEDWESAPGEDDQGIRTRESAQVFPYQMPARSYTYKSQCIVSPSPHHRRTTVLLKIRRLRTHSRPFDRGRVRHMSNSRLRTRGL